MGFGDPLPQAGREQEFHARYLERARERMDAAADRVKAARAERRYAALHEREAMRRMRISSQMEIARRINPRGGFWYVDDSAREHCPVCAARGGRNYTWDQLDRIDPTQNHAGCRCSILPALNHADWADEYNPLTEALVIQMIRRGKAWVPIARDTDSRFPQRFASKSGSSASAPPVKGTKRVGPKKLDKKSRGKGQRYSPGNFLASISQAKKKQLLRLGSYDLIRDMVGGRSNRVIKQALGGDLEEHVHPARVPSRELVEQVAEKVGLIPDRALLRIELHELREKVRDGVITQGQYVSRRTAIERELAKPASVRPRADRMPTDEQPPVVPPAPSTPYVIPAPPKEKPKGGTRPKLDDTTKKIEALRRNQNYEPSEILSAMGGHEAMGYDTREIALGAIRGVIDRMNERTRDDERSGERRKEIADRIRERVLASGASSEEAEKAVADAMKRSAAIQSSTPETEMSDAVADTYGYIVTADTIGDAIKLVRDEISRLKRSVTKGKTDGETYAYVHKQADTAREWIALLDPLVGEVGRSASPLDLTDEQSLMFDMTMVKALYLVMDTESSKQLKNPRYKHS